jgi:tetratricopeptide (TPR) repeat protein
VAVQAFSGQAPRAGIVANATRFWQKHAMIQSRAFLLICLVLLTAKGAVADPNALEKGRALLEKADYTAAIAVFKDTDQRSPTRAEALEGWGDALAGIGDRDGAIEKYKAALAIKPETRRLMMHIRSLGIGP